MTVTPPSVSSSVGWHHHQSSNVGNSGSGLLQGYHLSVLQLEHCWSITLASTWLMRLQSDDGGSCMTMQTLTLLSCWWETKVILSWVCPHRWSQRLCRKERSEVLRDISTGLHQCSFQRGHLEFVISSFVFACNYYKRSWNISMRPKVCGNRRENEVT